MSFAWSHTTYAYWHGLIFNFEDKWDLDYFLAHSSAERVSSNWAYKHYHVFPHIRISSSRCLGSNAERKRQIKEWKNETGY